MWVGNLEGTDRRSGHRSNAAQDGKDARQLEDIAGKHDFRLLLLQPPKVSAQGVHETVHGLIRYRFMFVTTACQDDRLAAGSQII
jgi:hypothetical protein